MKYSACRDMPLDLFFPKTGKSNDSRAAEQVCEGCAAREACDIYATENKITSGVWGARLRQPRGQAR